MAARLRRVAGHNRDPAASGKRRPPRGSDGRVGEAAVGAGSRLGRMRIGIGLPNPVPGISGSMLVEWARRAEERGFAGLATIDRLAYPSHDSLAALAAAAGATTRIGL